MSVRVARGRRALLHARVALAVGLTCAVSGCARERPPDIILIVVDTLRADHLGLYGYARETSPNLDRFAAESIVFEQPIAPASWTLPSVASIMTGTHPTVHGLRVRTGTEAFTSLRAGIATLPQLLRDEGGYRTAAIVANPWVAERRHGLAEGLDLFDTKVNRPAIKINDLARLELERASQTDQPSFLYLHYMDVHGPYNRGERAADLGPLPAELERALSPAERAALPAYLERPSAKRLSGYVEAYDQGIRGWDERFGELIQWLRENGRLEETILVVVSDHGEEFLEHGGWNHGGTLYQEQLFVPWIMRVPGMPAGRVGGGAVSLIDLAPTLLSAVGLTPPSTMLGKDLFAGPLDPDRWVFAETQASARGAGMGPLQSAALRASLKVSSDSQGERCFDLARDPREIAPIAVGAGCDASWLRTLSGWRDAMTTRGSALGGQRSFEPDAEDELRLRELGYVE